MKNLIMVLVCFCFLAYVDRDNQSMMFCNEIGDKAKISEMNINEFSVIMDWRKDVNKEDCSTTGCSYWRVIKTAPEETICVEIKYNYGAQRL